MYDAVTGFGSIGLISIGVYDVFFPPKGAPVYVCNNACTKSSFFMFVCVTDVLTTDTFRSLLS